MFRFRKKTVIGGWTVVSGKPGRIEVLREKRKAIIVASLAIFALLASYFLAAAPMLASHYRRFGAESLGRQEYQAAIGALERADFFSWWPAVGVTLPLGQAYVGDGQYAKAVALLRKFADRAAPAARRGLPDSGEPSAESGTSAEPGGSGADGERGGDSGDSGEGEYDGSGADGADGESGGDGVRGEPSLAGVFFCLAEAYAYLGDADSALAAADEGFAKTGDNSLLGLKAFVDVKPPYSLCESGAYSGTFAFRFEDVPAGILTRYTTDGSAPGGDAALYGGSVEIMPGANAIRAVNISKYGLASPIAAYDITVVEKADGVNGNVANRAMAAEQGGYTYYFNGSAIYKRQAFGEKGVKMAESADVAAMGVLGEWLYFSRASGTGKGVYRIRIDGSAMERITDDVAEYMHIVGNHVYYSNQSGFYSIGTDGAGRTALAEGGVRCLNYDSFTFYFIIDDEDGAYGTPGGSEAAAGGAYVGAYVGMGAGLDGSGPIYSYEIDGGKLARVGDIAAAFVQLDGGKLYYAEAGGGGNAIGVASLAGKKSGDVLLDEPFRAFLARSPSIYYIGADSGRIYSWNGGEAGAGGENAGGSAFGAAPAGAGAADASGAAEIGAAAGFGGFGQLTRINVADGVIYAELSGAETIYASIPLDRLAQGAAGYEVLSDAAAAEMHRFGGHTYISGTTGDTRALYRLPDDFDAAASGTGAGLPEGAGAGTDLPEGAGLHSDTGLDTGAGTGLDTGLDAGLDMELGASHGANVSAGAGAGAGGAVPGARSDATLVFSGIPSAERIVYASDGTLITSDHLNTYIYETVRYEPGSGGSGQLDAGGSAGPAGSQSDGAAIYDANGDPVANAEEHSVGAAVSADADAGTGTEAESVTGAGVGSGANADAGEASGSYEGSGSGSGSGANADAGAASGAYEGSGAGTGAGSGARAGAGGGAGAAGAEGSSGSAAAPAGENAGAADSGNASNGSMSDAGSGGASGADSGGVISGAGDGGEFSVVRRKLADNGLHVTVGLSRVESGGDRLYFVSQAGFFSTDEYFRSAAFICGDGPESYEKFVIAGGKVIFRKSGVSGKGGIYSMNLDGTAQVRLTDAEALDFAANGTDVYWLDADMHLFWLDALTGGRRQIGEWTADRIGLLDGGGILIRNAYDKFSLYLIDPVDGAGEKISAGSVGSFAAQGGQAAFCPWEASGSRFGAEYWLGMGI